ncbi:hypothetical protein Shyhy01_01070 [Streptomyces hygroscopicus subsp. hygroscopicus]|nr:hypothetical protein Shyhy01_01070 [Streptomyces hygroscopicus subsp. hygroscopicus]
MDPTELVSQTVRVVTELAGGAATAAATGVGQAVSDLVRQRLSGTPSGQAALAAVDARPDDPAAVAGLRNELNAGVAADQDFAAALAAALAPVLAGPPPEEPPMQTIQNSVVIDGGSRVRGNTISLGPVTFNNTPAGRTAFGTICVALATVVALLVYGSIQALDGDSPGSQTTGRPEPGQGRQKTGTDTNETGNGTAGTGNADRAMPLADAEAVRNVLPDATSLPSGWTEVSAATADVSSQDDGSTFEGDAEYQGSFSMETQFLVFSYPDEDTAQTAFDAKTFKAREQGARTLTMAKIGDQVAAFSISTSRGDAYVTHTSRSTVVRTGTVLTIVVGNDSEGRSYSSEDLESLTRLLSDRARTAQTG